MQIENRQEFVNLVLRQAVLMNDDMEKFTPEERLQVLEKVFNGYCRRCGNEDKCYCDPAYDI